jgi:RecA-family ATPase
MPEPDYVEPAAEILDIARPLAPIDLSAWRGRRPPEREWIVREFLPAGTCSLLTGAGSVGKSLLVQQLATCMATGALFLGMEVRRERALYLTCEDTADELWRRQVAINSALNVDMGELPGRLDLVSLVGAVGNELATFDRDGRIAPSISWRRLVRTVEALEVRFLALDNVSHLFAGNENDRAQVAAFCGLLNSLASEAGITILLLAHPNKAGDSYSGSTAWENQLRSRLYLERPKSDEEDRDGRRLSVGKTNMAARGTKVDFRWHEWAFWLPADIGAGGDDRAREAFDETAFLACLAERNRQMRPVSESRYARTYAPTEFAGMPESRGIGAIRLEAAMDRLFRQGRVERGSLGRSADRRKVIEGLRATPEECADLCADLAPTFAPTLRPPRADPAPTAPSHTSPYGGEMGGPLGPPAHSQDPQP